MIRADSLSLTRGGVRVLCDVSLAVAPGEVVAVVGPSGSGKSTLLHVLGGLLPASGGRWTVPPNRGFLSQDLLLLGALSAERNVALPLVVAGASPGAALTRARAALTDLGVEDLSRRPAARLSRGQGQRVALARALAGTPPALLLDEPTSALDMSARDLVVERLLARANAGAAVLLTTHDAAVATAAHRRYRMVDGRLERGEGGLTLPPGAPLPPTECS